MKSGRFLCKLALLLLLLSPLRTSEAASRAVDYQALILPRSVNLWIEGDIMDEMVLGARAVLRLVCIDQKLGFALARFSPSTPMERGTNEGPPAWLHKYTGNYNKRKGYTLFAAIIEVFKPWDFDTAAININGYVLENADVVTKVLDDPKYELSPGKNELQSGFHGYISFYVPSSRVKPGNEFTIAYGEHSVSLKLPK